MRRFPTTVLFLVLCANCNTAMAKDDLLETLAQKGVLTMEEYEKLKAERKGEVSVNTDDGFKVIAADGTAFLQVGTLQQLDVAHYAEDKASLSDGSELRRSRLLVSGQRN